MSSDVSKDKTEEFISGVVEGIVVFLSTQLQRDM